MLPVTPVTCSDIEPQLNKVWQEFHKDGVTDDLVIIEHIAYFLLLEHIQELDSLLHASDYDTSSRFLDKSHQLLLNRFKDASDNLIPNAPKGMSVSRLMAIASILKAALPGHTPADLFNMCVVTRLSAMIGGGRYTTPRHITYLMSRLADLRPNQSLADFACGSGGLLVASADLKSHVTGVEISPNWARIAWANTYLHALPNPKIHIGNAFSVFADLRSKPTFDRVLMNPPFGEAIDRDLVFRAFDVHRTEQFGGRSETLLTALALEHLRPGGRMVVLVPSTMLSVMNAGEGALRELLLETYQLQAIVSLPKDALQPYASFRTHLLVINNPPDEAREGPEAVWFYKVNHDGFSSGRNRRPEPEKSELPRLEATVLTQSNVLADTNGRLLITAQDIRVDGELAGYHITRRGDGKLTISCLNRTGRPSSSLLATLDRPSDSVCMLLQRGSQYSGSRQNRAIHIALAETTTVAGTYKLAYEGLDDLQLIVKARSARLERKDKLLIAFKTQSRRDRSGPALLIVDVDGVPMSLLFTVSSLDQLPKPLRVSTAGAFPLEHENGSASGHLIIFSSSTLEVAPLAGSDGQEVYLAELPDACLLLRPDAAKRLTRIEVTTRVTTFVGDPFHHGVAVDVAGKWFGVQVPTTEIILKHNAILQPTEYFPKETVPQQLRTPAELLGNIKRKHQQLDRHIDYLLGIVELRPIATAKIPPEIVAGLQPFGTLNEIQQAVWNSIQLQIETHSPDTGEPYITPRLFRAEDIRGTYPAADVQRALELFERMGLIVRVTIDEAPYYRLVAQSDLVGMEVAP